MVLNVIDDSAEVNDLISQARVFKALTHPVRIAVLNLLRDGERCVCHMEAHLGLRQAKLSQQLAVLRDAGLIQDRRAGWNIYYHVTNPEIFNVVDAMARFTGSSPRKSNLKTTLCECPQCASKRNSLAA